MNRTENFFVSWEELHRDTRALAARLMPASQWKGAIAITRGGMVPAAIVARELNIRLLDTICIKTYEKQEMSACLLYTSPSPRDKRQSRMPSSA